MGIITKTGTNDGMEYNYKTAVNTAVNEIITDHAGLIALEASLKTQVNANTVATTELITDHAGLIALEASLKTTVNNLRTYLNDGLLIHGTLAVSATPEKFKTTSLSVYTINGVTYTKPITDDLVFSSAYTINVGNAEGTFFGVFLVQIDAAGTVSTKAPAANQVYTSAALALAALPSPDALNVALGSIVVGAIADTPWTATTDSLTDDVASAVLANTVIKSLPAAVTLSPPATLTAAAPAAVTLSPPATLSTAALSLTQADY